jgi:hypothetical protein
VPLPENTLHALRARLADEAAETEFLIDVQAIRDLDAGLREAVSYLDLLVGSADRDRLSAHKALDTIVRFLHAHDRWRPAALPLARLEAALRDLQNGHVAAMLHPRDIRGRPVSWHETTLRGYAAGIMGGLMKHAAMSKDQAAKWVSKRLRIAGYEVATDTVIDWRKKALNHKRNPDLHRAYCAVLGEPDWSTPVPYAERLVAQIIRLHPQKGG